jgi:hypothetical protein
MYAEGYKYQEGVKYLTKITGTQSCMHRSATSY